MSTQSDSHKDALQRFRLARYNNIGYYYHNTNLIDTLLFNDVKLLAQTIVQELRQPQGDVDYPTLVRATVQYLMVPACYHALLKSCDREDWDMILGFVIQRDLKQVLDGVHPALIFDIITRKFVNFDTIQPLWNDYMQRQTQHNIINPNHKILLLVDDYITIDDSKFDLLSLNVPLSRSEHQTERLLRQRLSSYKTKEIIAFAQQKLLLNPVLHALHDIRQFCNKTFAMCHNENVNQRLIKCIDMWMIETQQIKSYTPKKPFKYRHTEYMRKVSAITTYHYRLPWS